MHAEALDWLTKHAGGLGTPGTVVDVGGRNINGSPRHLFPGSDYTAVDLHPGPGVDVVSDIRDWQPPAPVDVVVCAEVLEHAPRPAEVIDACRRLLRDGGTLLITAAAPPRAAHSHIDGGRLRDGEHYANIEHAQLHGWLAGWSKADVEYHPGRGDVYAKAAK